MKKLHVLGLTFLLMGASQLFGRNAMAAELMGGVEMRPSRNTESAYVPSLLVGMLTERSAINYFGLNFSISELEKKETVISDKHSFNLKLLLEAGTIDKTPRTFMPYNVIGLGVGATRLASEAEKKGLAVEVAWGASYTSGISTTIIGMELNNDSSLRCSKTSEAKCYPIDVGPFIRLLF